MNTRIEAKTTDEALKLIKKARLSHKNEWLFAEIHTPGKPPLLLKSFNLSIQILKREGIRYYDGFDLSAKQFEECIRIALEA